MKKIPIEETLLRKVLTEVISEQFDAIKSVNSQPLLKQDFDKRLITLKEIAELYSVSLVTVYKWRKAGILPKEIKRGSRIYFNTEEVLISIKS